MIVINLSLIMKFPIKKYFALFLKIRDIVFINWCFFLGSFYFGLK